MTVAEGRAEVALENLALMTVWGEREGAAYRFSLLPRRGGYDAIVSVRAPRDPNTATAGRVRFATAPRVLDEMQDILDRAGVALPRREYGCWEVTAAPFTPGVTARAAIRAPVPYTELVARVLALLPGTDRVGVVYRH